jgi:hypothetical protein
MNAGSEAKGEGMRGRGAARVIDMAVPARDEDANEFQGHYHDAGVSFIIT